MCAQVAAVVHDEEQRVSVRVGALILHALGQLLPAQLESGAFHSARHIYPAGFRTSRFYWSMRFTNRRCRYVCAISEVGGWIAQCGRLV